MIGDTGIASPTAKAVGRCAHRPGRRTKTITRRCSNSIGAIADSARQAIEQGAVELLGPLMDANHGLLRKLGVSCPELDALVLAARKAGAWGAKLSGGGRGGNMIALVNKEQAQRVCSRAAICRCGAHAGHRSQALEGLWKFRMSPAEETNDRCRVRELGITPGILPTGPLNAITDVPGVRVGHLTLIEGEDIRTGATAILPHPGNPFQDKVPAGFAVANGFGKFMGSTQVQELGELETPILLTNTLCVPRPPRPSWIGRWHSRATNRSTSINPVVGETNDGYLNDIRRRALTAEHARQAIEIAAAGPVAEGSVGAGHRHHGLRLESGHWHQLAPPACRRWAVTPWARWCRPTSTACCRWMACRWGKSSANTT